MHCIATISFPGNFLPAVVFVAETCVITLATIRTICIARGKKVPAAFLGFFEVSIWLFAISQVMQNLTSLSCSLAFACGFSLGNFLGVFIEQILALGNVAVQVTTKRDAGSLIEGLRAAGFGVTKLDGHGATGPVHVVFTVVQRKELAKVVTAVRQFDPRAFYSVNDLQVASEGVFPANSSRAARIVPEPLLRMYRVFGARSLSRSAEAGPMILGAAANFNSGATFDPEPSRTAA